MSGIFPEVLCVDTTGLALHCDWHTLVAAFTDTSKHRVNEGYQELKNPTIRHPDRPSYSFFPESLTLFPLPAAGASLYFCDVTPRLLRKSSGDVKQSELVETGWWMPFSCPSSRGSPSLGAPRALPAWRLKLVTKRRR